MKGDRVVIPFNICCGECHYCKNQMESQCDNSNPHANNGGLFGYSKQMGDYPGGQAEYLRVLYAEFTSFVVPESSELEDESLLFLSDVIPTSYWSVEHSGVKQGDTVVVLGCGPIGLMTQKFAWMKGTDRVIAVDQVPHRLEHDEIGSFLHQNPKGGADVVIDCVGMDGTIPPSKEHGSKGDN